jgi:tartrate-resistant acid phosphatase type 5
MASSRVSSFTFFAISDFGNPTIELRQVANAMHEYAQKNQSPAMILGLGDNFYPHGVMSPDDAAFQEVWSDIFLQVSIFFVCIIK